MKKIMLFILGSIFTFQLHAQKEKFDLVTHTPPKGWTKDAKENVWGYTLMSQDKKTFCQIGIYRSTTSKGSIDQDFDSEWQELVVKSYKPSAAPQTNEVVEAEGWKVKSGASNFEFDGGTGIVLLTTMSGYDRAVSIIALTNSQDYLKDIDAFMATIDLQQPEQGAVQREVDKTPPSAVATKADGFHYTVTNFDNGWVSTPQEDWVQVVKGGLTVLIHYPNQRADAYNSVLLDGFKNAWNILVAPRYVNASGLVFKPIQSWQSVAYAEMDATERASGKRVHVVFFKKYFSSGDGKFIEFVSADRSAFQREFGAFGDDELAPIWDRMANMSYYNKFGVDPGDLKGKWTNNFTGLTQYVSAYTGRDAGMDTHSSAQVYEFGPGASYHWQLSVASGFTGSIKFQNVKSQGQFSLPSIWKVYFSDLEGKPKTYDAYFSCIKGARVLWLDGNAYGKE